MPADPRPIGYRLGGTREHQLHGQVIRRHVSRLRPRPSATRSTTSAAWSASRREWRLRRRLVLQRRQRRPAGQFRLRGWQLQRHEPHRP